MVKSIDQTPVNQTPIIQSPFNKQRKDKFLLVLTVPEILKDDINKLGKKYGMVNFDSLQFSVYGAVVPALVVPAWLVPGATWVPAATIATVTTIKIKLYQKEKYILIIIAVVNTCYK